MIPILLPLIVLPAETPTVIFDRCTKAVGALREFQLSHSYESNLSGSPVTLSANWVVRSPQKAQVTVSEPRVKGRDGSYRRYTVEGSDFVGLDLRMEEYVKRSVSAIGSIPDRLLAGVGTAQEVGELGVSQAGIAKFFKTLLQTSDWQISKSGGTLTVKRAKGNTSAIIEIDAARNLPRDITVTNLGRKIHWSFRYSFAKSAFAPTIPTGYTAIREFVVEPEPPKFKTKNDELIFLSLKRAYRKWKGGVFTIAREGEVSKVIFSPTGIRETSKNFDWSYTKGNLTIVDHANKKAFAGPAKFNALIHLLSGLNIDYTLFSRNYLLRLAPFRELFSNDMLVKKEGELDFGSGPCDVLKAQSADIRLSIFVRKSDAFIDSMTVENLDPKGKPVSRVESKLSNVVRAVKESEFAIAIPKSYTFKPVPKL